MGTYYLYGLTQPRRSGFIYIGVTNSLKRRLYSHRATFGHNIRIVPLVAGHANYIYDLERRAIDVFQTRTAGANLSRGTRAPKREPFTPAPRRRRDRGMTMTRLRQLLRHDAQARKVP